MGKRGKQQKKTTKNDGEKIEKTQEELSENSAKTLEEALLNTLGDFTSKENWDQFFTIRDSDDPFEWYAEWSQIQKVLTGHLLVSLAEPGDSAAGPPPPVMHPAGMNILVPGCGNSKLSEHLYDAGFKNITNVDFSKVAISDMLRKNVRERPEMKWRVMDMTSMQFENETFDAIVDKGGLDALMEPKLGPRLGYLYLCEVKRLLKAGGKFVCLTLAESHVLDLLFPKFRFGWKMSLYAIAQEPSARYLNLQTFMVVAEKSSSSAVFDVSPFWDKYSVESHGNQARELCEALDREKMVRLEHAIGSDILYSLEDLILGVKGDLTELEPGRRIKLILGEPGVSHFIYDSILFDAQPDSKPFTYQYGVLLVPKKRSHDWLFSSEEGQWLIVISSRAARLLMVLLDSSHSSMGMEYIQMELSPLVRQLTPRSCEDGVDIPFMAAGDGTKQREIVHQVTSALTGPIVVEDVIYKEINDLDPHKDSIFRRLIFSRTENMVQSEALLSTKGSNEISSEVDEEKQQEAPKPRNKGKQRKSDSLSSGSPASSAEMKVVHNHLASSYHNGIISGIMLISSHLKGSNSAGGPVKTVVIGLGAGVLPMFMKNCLPSLKIEVVELDPVILDVARGYFGFNEDKRLKVNIDDGIKYVKEKAGGKSSKVDILIIDADSADSSSSLACPAAEFVEESFLLLVKSSLSEQGLFIINLVSRSSTLKRTIYARLKTVFTNIFSLQIEEDINEVIFALKADSPMKEDQLSEARNALQRSFNQEKEWRHKVFELSKSIKRLS